VRDVERAIRATSDARELCLSLQRAFASERALAGLRSGKAASLRAQELRIGLGLLWAAGDVEALCAALASLPAEQVAADPVLVAFRDVSRPR
jgi:hypothetical protein